MDSCSVKAALGFKGTVKGRAGAPGQSSDVGFTLRCDFTGTGNMLYDAATTGATFDIPAGATTTLDLTGGLLSPLSESIAGALAFSQVFAIGMIHDADSLNVASTVTAFNATSIQLFTGLLNAAGKILMAAGQGFAFICRADKAGMVVSAGQHKIDLLNNDGVNAATMRVFILGKVP